ncbi:hypothetical protein, partial [Schinkia azotoformans]|uniref:hypothetical protein n=1 Tax=Schinkia azotoformans TaxID=1454 RepID=UPI001B7FED6D
ALPVRNVGKPVSVLLLCLLHNNPLMFTTKNNSMKKYAVEKLIRPCKSATSTIIESRFGQS